MYPKLTPLGLVAIKKHNPSYAQSCGIKSCSSKTNIAFFQSFWIFIWDHRTQFRNDWTDGKNWFELEKTVSYEFCKFGLDLFCCDNPCGAESRIFWENWVNTMAVDALAPCVARSSVAIVMPVWDKGDPDFCEEKNQCMGCSVSKKHVKCQYIFLFVSIKQFSARRAKIHMMLSDQIKRKVTFVTAVV